MAPGCHAIASVNPVTGEFIDGRALDRERASCVTSEHGLVAWLEDLDDVDPSQPSRLPGWSIGHVLTHLARNADGMLSMLDGEPQYPHGLEGRNADIEAGAARPWPALVDDVVMRSAAVEAALKACEDWSGTVRTLRGERARVQLPMMRQREVEVHRVDLGLGYEFTNLPPDYVRRELRLMEMLWKARKPMGMTPLPDRAKRLDPATRLAWLMGRVDVDGLEPARLL